MDHPPQLITSLQNEQIKALVRLRNRRDRDSRQLVIIEEPLVIQRALAAGYPLQTVYFCPEQLDHGGQAVLDALRSGGQVQLIQVTPPVMAKASYRDRPEGLLAVAPQVSYGLDDLKGTGPNGRPALMVVMEGVEKPGNLGAVLRIADGAGADAVLVCGTPGSSGPDLFNPNVLRASRGACFALPTVAAAGGDILEFLRGNGITTVATSPAAGEVYSTADLTGPVALVLGTEHDGLSDEMLAACDGSVSIPMLGRGDSLNVAASCAVILYEAVRQRRQNKG